jgi:hypothetical protein
MPVQQWLLHELLQLLLLAQGSSSLQVVQLGRAGSQLLPGQSRVTQRRNELLCAARQALYLL